MSGNVTAAFGTVTATGPLQVTLDGASTATPAHALYAPTVGDRVLVLQVNGRLVALGVIGA